MSNKPLTPLPTPGVSPVYLILALAITAGSFLAGLAIGFAGRPLLVEDKVVEVIITAPPNPASTDTATPPPMNLARPADSLSIMDVALSDARHFLGEASAPVTIIEFSDFQ